MNREKDYTKIPNKEKEPYTYSRWKDMGILKASPIERLIVLELFEMKGANDWLHQRENDEWWDEKDMRAFAKDLAKKILKLLTQPK